MQKSYQLILTINGRETPLDKCATRQEAEAIMRQSISSYNARYAGRPFNETVVQFDRGATRGTVLRPLTESDYEIIETIQ